MSVVRSENHRAVIVTAKVQHAYLEELYDTVYELAKWVSLIEAGILNTPVYITNCNDATGERQQSWCVLLFFISDENLILMRQKIPGCDVGIKRRF